MVRSAQPSLTSDMPTAGSSPPGGTVADALGPVVDDLFRGSLPIRLEFWDGSALASVSGSSTIRITSPDALTRILWSPNELGLCRAYIAGDLEIDGNIFDLVTTVRDAKAANTSSAGKAALPALKAAVRLGVVRRPVPPPPEEARLRGRRHSRRRDSKAIEHHYDVGNDFYRLVLGPSMTYSCARFVDEPTTLEEAQAHKYELVCRKLGLHERPDSRLLDVGCGWGSMAIHAAVHHRARVVGVTISESQAELARQRVVEAGVADLVEIRLQDYRDLRGESFDAVSSIGMSEHVGHNRIDEYFETMRGVLADHGRMLNHAISSIGGSKLGRTSFVARYVFPDGELIDVGNVVLAMERAGFEVRDVESLREHYARTLRAWVDNIEANWQRAVELVGEPRAKIWRIYMAGSAIGFGDAGISLHQVLGVVDDPSGGAMMPATRRSWE